MYDDFSMWEPFRDAMINAGLWGANNRGIGQTFQIEYLQPDINTPTIVVGKIDGIRVQKNELSGTHLYLMSASLSPITFSGMSPQLKHTAEEGWKILFVGEYRMDPYVSVPCKFCVF